jgi:class 3 adenylate cyclase/tetratricopeptide (TPR) repeat protein
MTAVFGPESVGDRARANEKLRPYVPRLVIDWLREEPTAVYREVEGSMAFVDISGFTALSERLARRGKIGAELMRDTLNDVFMALLDTAYDDGAGLLKWGGDALLLLFEGPDHERRACHACWEMQRTLDRVGRLKAGGSTIVLRMSIGIHTGTFQFFLTGSVHRELLIAGPDATRTVTMEAIADAGEISMSPELAALLDPVLVGPPRGESLLLASAPEIGVRRAPDVGDVSGLDLPLCLPLALRAHVMLEKTEPEHRTITAAFIEMMDTDVQLEHLGIDGLAEALDERIRTIQEVALHYEVPFYESDIGKSSVKALLTAGAPSTTGHDEERMLRALREIVETPGAVDLRIGVNTGRVFTGDFGPSYRRSYRVFGDAINTAARVMSKAEAGQVLATEIVLERSRTAFVTTPIAPFAAKGKSEPIRASIVGPVIGQREAELRETPFVGRERELEALLRVVEAARQSKGSIVDLSGGPGLGKTRLLRDLISRAGEVFVFHTRCEEYESSTPYFPLRAPFRAVLGLSPGDSAEAIERRLRQAVQNVDATIVPWVPLFGVLLGIDIPPTPETKALDERFIQERLADVMMRFLYTALAGTTTMLVVEDAQHIDESSRDLLRRLARAGVDRKQVLFVTHDGTASLFDASETEDLNSLSFTLAPLTLQAAIDMVHAVTEDDPLPPHVVEEIARRSAGSPLFLVELLDVVRESGSVEALPDSVEAVIAAGIDRLAPADRTVLRYAAVLGTSFDPGLLVAALQDEVDLDEGVWGRLADLVEREENTGELRFRNALIRDAAYEGLPFRRRRVLHGRIGGAIEVTAGEEDVGALALHFYEAQRWDKAWTYCCRAGQRAQSIYANVEAARFLERAVKASGRVREIDNRSKADVWVALGRVRESAGMFEPSIDAFGKATVLLRDYPVEKARALELRAQARGRTGAYSAALRDTATGLKLLEGSRSKQAIAARALLRAMRATVLSYQSRASEAIPFAKAAVRDAQRADEPLALTRAYTTLDASYQILGRPEKAVHELLSLGIYERMGQIRRVGIVELNLGVQSYWDGRWDEAVEWFTRAQDDCGRAGDLQHVAIAGASLAEVLISRGTLDEAERLLTEARRVLRSARFTPFAIFADIQLSRCALERGDDRQALEIVERVAAEAATLEHAAIRMYVSIHYALANASVGDPAKGLESLGAAARTTGRETMYLMSSFERARAVCLAELGRLDEARRALDVALAEAIRQGLVYEQLLVRQALRDTAEPENVPDDAEGLLEVRRLEQLLGMTQRASLRQSLRKESASL